MKRAKPSSAKIVTPTMIQRTAQGEGSSERFFERSIRRCLSSVSISVSGLSQSRKNFFPGRHSRRKQPAQRAHEDSKHDAGHHDFRADAEVECDFAEGYEAANTGRDVVQRKHQQATNQTADDGKQQRFQKKTEE